MNSNLTQQDHVPMAKAVVNYLAAMLGIGTFLGFVNLMVGLLSAGWLLIQIYGYIVHELPMKRIRKLMMEKELARLEKDVDTCGNI